MFGIVELVEMLDDALMLTYFFVNLPLGSEHLRRHLAMRPHPHQALSHP